MHDESADWSVDCGFMSSSSYTQISDNREFPHPVQDTSRISTPTYALDLRLLFLCVERPRRFDFWRIYQRLIHDAISLRNLLQCRLGVFVGFAVDGDVKADVFEPHGRLPINTQRPAEIKVATRFDANLGVDTEILCDGLGGQL